VGIFAYLMAAHFNDIEPSAAQRLRNLMTANHCPCLYKLELLAANLHGPFAALA
jgi:hypothetical protein